MYEKVPLNLTVRDISVFYMDKTPSLHYLKLPLEIIENIISYVANDMMEYIKNRKRPFNDMLNSYLTRLSNDTYVENLKRVVRKYNICNQSMMKNIKTIENNSHLQWMLNSIPMRVPQYLDTNTYSLDDIGSEIVKSNDLTKKYYRRMLLKEVKCRICRNIIDKYFIDIVDELVFSEYESPFSATAKACLGISIMCKAIRDRLNS